MHRKLGRSAASLLCLAISGFVGAVVPLATRGSQDPQRPDSYDSSAPGAPANPDAGTASKTATSDHLMAQKIQKAILSDETLSAIAHKVQVTVRAGKATLQGQVASLAERNKMMSKATDIAGAGNVVNRMKISTTPE
jgi:BON domain